MEAASTVTETPVDPRRRGVGTADRARRGLRARPAPLVRRATSVGSTARQRSPATCDVDLSGLLLDAEVLDRSGSRWPTSSRPPRVATRCSAARTSTSPRTGPCCTRRALRHGRLLARARGRSAGRGRRASRVLRLLRPRPVRSALGTGRRTVVVVSCKSGGTVETDCQRRPTSRPSGTPASSRPSGSSSSPTLARRWKDGPDAGYRCSTRTQTSAAATPRSPRSAWCPAAWRCRHRRLLDDADAVRPALRTTRSKPRPAARARCSARPTAPGDNSRSSTAARRTRVRRLGRAADRRDHRQGRHRHPAGRSSTASMRRIRAEHRRRGAAHSARASSRQRPPPSGCSAPRRR